MWIARAVAQLVVTVAIAFMVVAVVAGLLALVRSGEFLDSLRLTALFIGVLLLLMGASGGAFSRAADAEARGAAVGRLPGMSWAQSRPEEPTVSRSAVFAISGLALIVLGAMLG